MPPTLGGGVVADASRVGTKNMCRWQCCIVFIGRAALWFYYYIKTVGQE